MRITTLVLLALPGGCASVSGGDCGGDWYALGARDGRLGATPQAQSYAARCGMALDDERYREGWRAGNSERPIPLW